MMDQARLEDLQIWKREKEKTTKKGSKTFTYWMASWREGSKVRKCPSGQLQEDGCGGCKAEGQKDEG